MSKILHTVGVIALMSLAIACGSSASTATSTDTAIEVSGVVDTSIANQKPRFATSSSNVVLINIDTDAKTDATVTGNLFTALVLGGTYEIQSNMSGSNLSKIIGVSNDGTNKSSVGAVNLDSTVAVKYIKQSTGANTTALLRSISDLAKFVKLTEQMLVGLNTSANATLSQELSSFRSVIKNDLTSGIDVGTKNYTGNFTIKPSDTKISEYLRANNTSELAIVMTKPSDFTGVASISIVDASSYSVKSNIVTYTATDFGVTSYDRQYYVLGRYGLEYTQKYDASSPSTPLFPNNYSTKSPLGSAQNPHDLVFASKTSALLTLYGSGNQWLVNPSSRTEAGFKTSEIDLSHYDSSDNIAEFSKGVYVQNKFFLAAQRLDRNDSWSVNRMGYVAVLDGSGNEINTGKAETGSSLKGIALNAMNPLSIQYSAHDGLIYVLCSGPLYSKLTFTSAVVTINPSTYETKILIDDDAGVNASTTDTSKGTYGGTFNKLALVSKTLGYLTTFATVDSTYTNTQALRSFDPSTGNVNSVITGFESKDIRSLSVDSKGQLWVCSTDGISILETTNHTVIKTISTTDLGQIPDSLTFIRY